MRDHYYRSGDGFLLVYGIDVPESTKDVEERFHGIIIARVIYNIYLPIYLLFTLFCTYVHKFRCWLQNQDIMNLAKSSFFKYL